MRTTGHLVPLTRLPAMLVSSSVTTRSTWPLPHRSGTPRLTRAYARGKNANERGGSCFKAGNGIIRGIALRVCAKVLPPRGEINDKYRVRGAIVVNYKEANVSGRDTCRRRCGLYNRAAKDADSPAYFL